MLFDDTEAERPVEHPSSPISTWNLQAGETFNFQSWSYGLIKDVDDLYDKFTFEGEPLPGMPPVFASGSPQERRRLRMGHMWLAVPCGHPLDCNELVLGWPICPIAFRVDEDGTVNELGKKCEALVRANLAQARELPPKGSEDYYKALRALDSTPLYKCMFDIIGIPPFATELSPETEGVPWGSPHSEAQRHAPTP